MSGGDASWDTAVRTHGVALERFVAAAAAVPASRWGEPRAPGKWSPAEIGEHLVLGYETILRELSGEEGMRIVLPAWKRTMARLLYLRRILRGQGFPTGARSPRETRPVAVRGSQQEVVRALQTLGARVEREAREARAGSRRRITHAYFGRMTLEQGMLLSAKHLDHHRAQLPA